MSSSIKNIGIYPSANGTDRITYYIYTPKKNVRAILQISHGMCEYIERYEEFAEFLTSKGVLVCGNDHLGHGASVSSSENFGFFSSSDGWSLLPQDLNTLTQLVKRRYPGLPTFLLGHSMGSFVARLYITTYHDDISGAIIMGTSGGEPLAPIGKRLAEAIIRHKGEKYRSNQLNRLIFGAFNSKIIPSTSLYDWISRDTNVVRKYSADPACNFKFTARGCFDLISMLEEVSKDSWPTAIPDSLPILLLSGEADPVGAYGKGVEKVFHKLADAGKNVEMRLYSGARHELLQEINRKQIFLDVWHWLRMHIPLDD